MLPQLLFGSICRAGWLRYQLPYELEQRLMFRPLIAFCEKFPNLNLG